MRYTTEIYQMLRKANGLEDNDSSMDKAFDAADKVDIMEDYLTGHGVINDVLTDGIIAIMNAAAQQ